MLTDLPIFKQSVPPYRHIEIVGKVHKFLGGVGILASLLPIIFGLNSVLNHRHDMGGLALYVGLIWLAQSLPAYIGGKALLNSANWGRRLLITVCAIEALVIPAGTAWAIYCWWVLFRRPTLEAFGLISDDPAQQRAQNQSRVVWRTIQLLAYLGIGWWVVLHWVIHVYYSVPGGVWLIGFVAVAFILYWRLGQAVLAISEPARKRAVIVALVIIGLVPTWDMLPGLAYFGYLCKTEGGLRVSRMARATEIGRPFQFSVDAAESRRTGRSELDGPYEHRYEFQYLPLSVLRGQDKVIHRNTSERLGALTQLYWAGGWVLSTFGITDIGIGCPSSPLPVSELLTKTLERSDGVQESIPGPSKSSAQ